LEQCNENKRKLVENLAVSSQPSAIRLRCEVRDARREVGGALAPNLQKVRTS